MNVVLWIIAGLLALGFLASGAMKLLQSKEKLAETFPFARDFSSGTVALIGVLEILAAVGLILPAALDVVPVLVPVAAVGLVLLMAGAVVTHLRRRELQAVMAPVALLAMAAFVAVGRFGPEPFTG